MDDQTLRMLVVEHERLLRRFDSSRSNIDSLMFAFDHATQDSQAAFIPAPLRVGALSNELAILCRGANQSLKSPQNLGVRIPPDHFFDSFHAAIHSFVQTSERFFSELRDTTDIRETATVLSDQDTILTKGFSSNWRMEAKAEWREVRRCENRIDDVADRRSGSAARNDLKKNVGWVVGTSGICPGVVELGRRRLKFHLENPKTKFPATVVRPDN